MPQLNKKSLGQQILAKCVTNKNPLERDGCKLRLSASNVVRVLDMDEDPIRSKMEDEGKRCDFAAYQRPNPTNNRAHLVLVEFKAGLHKVNKTLRQLSASLEFLTRLAEIPEFAFDSYTPVLVRKGGMGKMGEIMGPVGPRNVQQIKDEQRRLKRLKGVKHYIKGGTPVQMRPLLLISGDELTDKQIAENGQPWKPKAARKRGKG